MTQSTANTVKPIGAKGPSLFDLRPDSVASNDPRRLRRENATM